VKKLLVAADVLGRDAQTGKVVRALVTIDSTPARLLYVQEGEGRHLVVDEFDIVKIERGGYSRIKNYTFVLDGRDPISIQPQSCVCGAGRIAYADPTPGVIRVPAIMPEGLEVKV
jgi:hypothetical protein